MLPRSLGTFSSNWWNSDSASGKFEGFSVSAPNMHWFTGQNVDDATRTTLSSPALPIAANCASSAAPIRLLNA